MNYFRSCSRTACSASAVTTLTYVYADSTAVLGPLARTSEPHSYDLCELHATRLTVPRGWEIIRIPGSEGAAAAAQAAEADDLVAIADAVRDRVLPREATPLFTPEPEPDATRGTAQRGHLRALPDPTEQ